MSERLRQIVWVLLLLGLPAWGLRISDAVAPQMDAIESGEDLDAEKYSCGQYQSITRALAQSRGRLRVMSFNMLFNRREDRLDPQHHWKRRLPRVAALINEANPDVIGSQELYADQLEELMELIGETYAFYGRGTTDGGAQGEINGVFYRKERFQPLLCRVFWMSPHPDVPGPDPYSAVSRTLTMVQLYDRCTGKRFALFNSHLPFSSLSAREYGARYIANLTNQYASEIPVIVTGDFNTFPNRPDLEGLPAFDGHWTRQILTSGALVDAADVSVLGHVGPISTYNNEGSDPTPFSGDGMPGVVLDSIYVSHQICVLLHAIDSTKVDGNYPSDHKPVIADLLIWD